jgi:hypothetical protein
MAPRPSVQLIHERASPGYAAQVGGLIKRTIYFRFCTNYFLRCTKYFFRRRSNYFILIKRTIYFRFYQTICFKHLNYFPHTQTILFPHRNILFRDSNLFFGALQIIFSQTITTIDLVLFGSSFVWCYAAEASQKSNDETIYVS